MKTIEILFLPSQIRALRDVEVVPRVGDTVEGPGLSGAPHIVTKVELKTSGMPLLTAGQG